MIDLTVLLSVLGLLLVLLTWLFKPESLRRLLRLERPPEPPPHTLSGVQIQDFLKDPIIGAAVREAEQRGATFVVVKAHQVAAKLHQGSRYFCTSAGARCRYVGSSAMEEYWLLIRDGAA